MNKFRNYLRALIFAIRPFENAQHFAMTIAGFSYASYMYKQFIFNTHTIYMFLSVFCFLSHVLSFNSYATFEEDLLDHKKHFKTKFKSIDKIFLFWISVIFFILTILFSLFIDIKFSMIFILLMIVWGLYTHPIVMLKKGRFLPFLFDLITMPYLFIMGAYIVNKSININIILFSIFFGITEIAGHINHMTLDYEIDKKTGIKTLAVRMGAKKTFIIANIFFIIAPLYFLLISLYGVFPKIIGIVYIPGAIIQVLNSFNILNKGFKSNDAVKFRLLYRIVYFIESIVLEIYMITNIFI